MRALLMDGFGEPALGRLADTPVPEIGPKEVLVRIAAAAINPVDWKEVAGMLKDFYPPYPRPWIPGFDGSGVVERVGADVLDLKAGDRVMIRPDRATDQGVLAEFAKARAENVVKVPANLPHAQIACMASALRTAWQAFRRPDVCNLKPGQSVLVDGASGGVGSYAVGLARALGARVAATCRPANSDYVCDLGAELMVDYRNPAALEQLRAWAPDGFDVVLDCFNGGQKVEMLDLIKPGGGFIALATLTNDADVAAVSALAAGKGRNFHFLLLDYGRLHEDMAEMAPLLESGGLKMPDITSYPLERAAEALGAMRLGQVRGKMVVTVADLA